jgi:hypothetical protein
MDFAPKVGLYVGGPRRSAFVSRAPPRRRGRRRPTTPSPAAQKSGLGTLAGEYAIGKSMFCFLNNAKFCSTSNKLSSAEIRCHKESLQWEVWGVENSGKRSVWVSDRGDGCYFSFLFSCYLVSNLFPFPLSSAQRVGMCYNNKGCAAFAFLFLILRQYNGATFHACAIKGSAACGKKSTKIMKIHILALRVPGADLQAQLTVRH